MFPQISLISTNILKKLKSLKTFIESLKNTFSWVEECFQTAVKNHGVFNSGDNLFKILNDMGKELKDPTILAVLAKNTLKNMVND